MTTFLLTEFNYQANRTSGILRFPIYEKNISDNVCALYRKYQDELVYLSVKLVPIRESIVHKFDGYPGFCDIESEFLYILIRETKPEIIFEISSRYGFTTNFAAAAIDKNGIGRLECFEITESFNGIPTEEVIRTNISGHISDIPINIHIGDARVEVSKLLKHMNPNFLILDSLHTDVFSEFYINVLFHHASGPAYIQDIYHHEPRPEWASESYYTLNHMLSTGNNFLPIAQYEDDIIASGFRTGIASQRNIRSSSIYFNLPEPSQPAAENFLNLFNIRGGKIEKKNISLFPINALDLDHISDPKKIEAVDNDNYFSPQFLGKLNSKFINHASLMAIFLGKANPEEAILNALKEQYEETDPFHRVMILSALANNGRQEDAVKYYFQKNHSCVTQGIDVNVILATLLMKCGEIDECKKLLERCLEQGKDKRLTGSPSQLFLAALVASRLGYQKLSRALIATAHSYVKFHDDAGIEKNGQLKLARILFRIGFRRPRMFIHAIRSDFPIYGAFGGFLDFCRYDLIPRLLRLK